MKHTPRTAQSSDEIAALDRDNLDIGFYWMVVEEGHVAIEGQVAMARQIPGQPAEVVLMMPRSIFNQFVDWYNTGVEPKGEDSD